MKTTEKRKLKYFKERVIKNEGKFDKEKIKMETIIRYLEEKNKELAYKMKEIHQKRLSPHNTISNINVDFPKN